MSLRDRQREVKEAAHEGVVRITENANGAFVFCSEEVFERRMRHDAEEARYAERVMASSLDSYVMFADGLMSSKLRPQP